jgi:hypothetical protein
MSYKLMLSAAEMYCREIERQVKIEALKRAEIRLTERFDLFYSEDLKKMFKKRNAEKLRLGTIASLKRAEAKLNARWEEIGVEPPNRGTKIE